MNGDIWLIYAQYLLDHWSKNLGQGGAFEFRLLLVYRRDCAVHITGNTSLYPMSSQFEDCTKGRQVDSHISDLLGSLAEWDNSVVRVTIFPSRNFVLFYLNLLIKILTMKIYMSNRGALLMLE